MSAPTKLTATALALLSLIALSSALAPATTLASQAALRPSAQARAASARSGCPARPARRAHPAHHASRSCPSHASRLDASKTHATRQSRQRVAGAVAHPRRRALPSSIPTGEASVTPTAQASSATDATVAAVLATPCANTEVTPEAANVAVVRAAVLCLINHKRAESGEEPLRISQQLEEAAEGHCQELIADDYFAHVSPSGETPVDRIRDTGYIPNSTVGYVIGENLAWGTYQLSTPQAIVAAWIASPGHLANILEAKYTETGIGVTPAVPASLGGGAPGATYAQEFGVIIQ